MEQYEKICLNCKHFDNDELYCEITSLSDIIAVLSCKNWEEKENKNV